MRSPLAFFCASRVSLILHRVTLRLDCLNVTAVLVFAGHEMPTTTSLSLVLTLLSAVVLRLIDFAQAGLPAGCYLSEDFEGGSGVVWKSAKLPKYATTTTDNLCKSSCAPSFRSVFASISCALLLCCCVVVWQGTLRTAPSRPCYRVKPCFRLSPSDTTHRRTLFGLAWFVLSFVWFAVLCCVLCAAVMGVCCVLGRGRANRLLVLCRTQHATVRTP